MQFSYNLVSECVCVCVCVCVCLCVCVCVLFNYVYTQIANCGIVVNSIT